MSKEMQSLAYLSESLGQLKIGVKAIYMSLDGLGDYAFSAHDKAAEDLRDQIAEKLEDISKLRDAISQLVVETAKKAK